MIDPEIYGELIKLIAKEVILEIIKETLRSLRKRKVHRKKGRKPLPLSLGYTPKKDQK